MDTPVARILRASCLFSGGAMDSLIDQWTATFKNKSK